MRADRISILNLQHDEQNWLDQCLTQLGEKRARNVKRAALYDGKNAQRDIGIKLPPHMKRIPFVLGWSAKACDVLNDLCSLDGFTTPGGSTVDSLGVSEIWDTNFLANEAPQAGVSSLIHATAFLFTTQGDTDAGEPDVLVTAKDALLATGTWNKRKRALDSALSIIDTDSKGSPTSMVLYMPGKNVLIDKTKDGWKVARREHAYGMPVEPLVYQPRLSRPFGSSRISRAVMSLNAGGVRSVIRTDITAERYSLAQRILLGADASVFQNEDGTPRPIWQAALDEVWAIPDDEDAEKPRAEVKEFSPGSQEPHMSQLRQIAMLFAGETSIPLEDLGIGSEANPTSEGSHDKGRANLRRRARSTVAGWAPAWTRTMHTALRMKHRLDVLGPEMAGVRPDFGEVRRQISAAAADSGGKVLDKFPWLAESELGLEVYGMDREFIDRAMREKRRVEATTRLGMLAAANVQGGGGPAAVEADDPETLKKKFDALGVAIRSGVDPEDAAKTLGLAGIKFTGAVPVTLRQPESEAGKLEEK